jgi:hypothetical protein
VCSEKSNDLYVLRYCLECEEAMIRKEERPTQSGGKTIIRTADFSKYRSRLLELF